MRHNLLSRTAQFTGQKKKSEEAQILQMNLSINSNTKPSPSYVLWFKDSIHTIFWQKKWLKKSLEQFTDKIKMWKEYQRVGNELSIKDNIKALKYKSYLSFCTYQKEIVEFTDSTNTIYWPTNIAKKATNCWKKYMSGLNTFQYKQCLCTFIM